MRAIFQEKGKNKGKKYLKRVKKKAKYLKIWAKITQRKNILKKRAGHKLVVKGITIEIQQHCMKFVHS